MSTFSLHENIFITLQYCEGILEIFWNRNVECSSNILEILLCDYWNLPKNQHLLSPNHTLSVQKQRKVSIKNFFKWIFKNFFSTQMFPGCPEHCNALGTLKEYSWNNACRLGITKWKKNKKFRSLNQVYRRFWSNRVAWNIEKIQKVKIQNFSKSKKLVDC